MWPNQKIKIETIPDGSSNTLLFGERPPSNNGYYGWLYFLDWDTLLWARASSADGRRYSSYGGVDCGVQFFSPPALPAEANSCNTNKFWSYHSGGGQFVLGDGSVRFFPYSVGTTTILQMATRAGGEVVSGN